MEIKKQLIKREIAGDVILVPVGKSVLENNGLYALNELAGFIWDLLPIVSTKEEIVSRILEEYEIDKETATKDCEQFLNELKEMEII